MRARSLLTIAIACVSALAACRGPKAQPEQPTSTTTIAASKRSEAYNAPPTGERGIYRIDVRLDRIEKVRIVPTQGDRASGRTVDPDRWSYDPPAGRLRVDAPVDDAHETVVVLGARQRPLELKLNGDADMSTVRVVVGDRIGVEGQDYVFDRKVGVVRFLGPDTPENPLRYYVEYSLRPDPAHPEHVQSVAAGNRGDTQTIRRLLDAGPR